MIHRSGDRVGRRRDGVIPKRAREEEERERRRSERGVTVNGM